MTIDDRVAHGYPKNRRDEQLSPFIPESYEVHEWRHALVILRLKFPEEYGDIADVLTGFRLHTSGVSVGGDTDSRDEGSLRAGCLRCVLYAIGA